VVSGGGGRERGIKSETPFLKYLRNWRRGEERIRE